MSEIQSFVGAWKFQWKSIPQGREGVARLEVKPLEVIEVYWKLDAQGLWLSLPYGNYGFDLQGEIDDSEKRVFRVTQRGTGVEWSGLFASLGSAAESQVSGKGKTRSARIRAQMPGKIIRILIKEGQSVKKDQPLIVMEAMKMENEIRAPEEGKIKIIKVSQGQAVETGTDLLLD